MKYTIQDNSGYETRFFDFEKFINQNKDISCTMTDKFLQDRNLSNLKNVKDALIYLRCDIIPNYIFENKRIIVYEI